MDIRVGGGGAATVSPAELLITDPLGHRTGYDPSSRTIVRELPAGVGEYGRERLDDDVTGEAGSESVQLSLSSPDEGLYLLTLTGVLRGEFWLEFHMDDTSGKFSHKLFTGRTDRGRVYRYRIEYSNKNADNTLVIPDTYRIQLLPPLHSERANVFEGGSTVPIRFRLTDREGKHAPGVNATLSIQKEDGKPQGGTPTGDLAKGLSSEERRVHFLPRSGIYYHKMSTKSLSKGKWKIIIHLEDGSEHVAFLEVR
ncbi:MAG TPA: PxKF domain-containing protein [Candidatus Methylomirabilis sp.]|nr:PxKF domain-containing protein [Candidatus Methylomirabilis sp.]